MICILPYWPNGGIGVFQRPLTTKIFLPGYTSGVHTEFATKDAPPEKYYILRNGDRNYVQNARVDTRWWGCPDGAERQLEHIPDHLTRAGPVEE
jgi:hypothetical protein